jgi:hypothetical protein
MKARCHKALNQVEEAKNATLQAIKINANFREAIDYMAALCGPKNAERWLAFGRTANNEDVLFVRRKAGVGFKVHFCAGMQFFGKKMLSLWNCEQYNPLTDADGPCFFEGLYFAQDYALFTRHRDAKVANAARNP